MTENTQQSINLNVVIRIIYKNLILILSVTF